MFDNVKARFVLRTALVAVIAGLATLKGALGDGVLDTAEIVDVVENTLQAAAAYAGIGALIPQVEPSIGVKQEDD